MRAVSCMPMCFVVVVVVVVVVVCVRVCVCVYISSLYFSPKSTLALLGFRVFKSLKKEEKKTLIVQPQ